MNWLQKIGMTIHTEQLPALLTQAIQYECGGEWELGPVRSWTEDLEKITNDKRLGEETGYSTSFWISCKKGDGMFNQKWGVSVNFTVTSGSSHTTVDPAVGDWDLTITANVQWASPKSWTPESPYALLIKSVGHQENMKTVQEVAQFVKQTILESQGPDQRSSQEILQSLAPEIARRAQIVYDKWDQSDTEFGDPDLGFGGICQDIAEQIAEVISNQTQFEVATVSAQIGEQHVWVVAKTPDGVFSVDIPPWYYERGGGYNWEKLQDIQFDENFVVVDMVSPDPNDFDEMVGDW